jgi:hypothetical protein
MVATSSMLAVTLALGGACTLALDHGPLGTACRFDGADGICGSCIRQSCGAELATCCGAEACQDTLTELDRCAGGDDQDACSKLRQDVTMGTCVASACKALCLGKGKGDCTGDATYCSCNDLAPSDPATCGESSVGGGVCCADLGWPGSGLSCTCHQVRCRATTGGCECSSGEGPDLECSGLHCCASQGVCRCSATPCESNETVVGQCSSDTGTCISGTRVSSCAVAVPGG